MSRAAKDFERWACRQLGAQRKPSVGPGGWARGSDDDGSCYFSLECKYSKRVVPEGRWIEQARRQSKADGRPWLLAVRGHGSSEVSRAVAVLDFLTLVEIAQKAGLVDEIEVGP